MTYVDWGGWSNRGWSVADGFVGMHEAAREQLRQPETADQWG